MKKILIIAALLLLAGCGPSRSQRESAFMTKCVRSEFSYAQCAVLFDIKEDANDMDGHRLLKSLGVVQ